MDNNNQHTTRLPRQQYSQYYLLQRRHILEDMEIIIRALCLPPSYKKQKIINA